MSQYIAVIKGSKGGEYTRLGHKTQGIQAEARGWDLGVRVIGRYDKETGKDVFDIYKTGGTNSPENRELIATIS